MSARVVGIDMGDDNARLVAGRLHKGAFEILDAALVPVSDVGEALSGMGLSKATILVGVTGRDMILRTIQVPPVPDWQLRELMGFEIEDVADQSGDELAADYNLLGGASAFADDDMALLALVRRRLIDERNELLGEGGARASAFTPNAVALHNAYVATDGADGTVMIANLGGATTDIALVHDGELLFARNLSGGGDLFTEALVDAFGLPWEKAEAIKRKRGVLARPGERLAGQQAAVAQALGAGTRLITNMLNSSVMLCRNQLGTPELDLTRVLLCGPGAALPGLDEALSRSLDVPTERFDPCDGYVVGDVDLLEERGADYAVPAGLAMMGALGDSYRIEILDAATQRRREFREKTVWLWGAAVVVLFVLALHFVVTRADHQTASEDLVHLQREVRSRTSDLQGYERALREADEFAADLAMLEAHTAPGSGVLTTLDLLERHLPPELWVTAVRTLRRVDPEFGAGGDARPYVVVEGRGKEIARDLSDAVTELTSQLRRHPGVAGVLPSLTTDSRGDFAFDLRLDLSVARDAGTDAATAADEHPGDAAEGGA